MKINDNAFTGMPLSQALSVAPGGQDADEKVGGAARDFEGLLIKQMLDEMWKSVPKSDFLNGGRAEELYTDMLHESLAKDIADNGGIGLRRELEASMRKYEQGAREPTSNKQIVAKG